MFSEPRSQSIVVKALLPLLIGIGLLIAAGASGVRTNTFVSRAAAADGSIARLNAGGSHPEVEFTSRAGQRISYPQGGLIFGYQVGQRVRVLYDPADPSKTATVDAIGALWADSIGLTFLGLGFTAAALICLIRAVRRRP